MTRKLSLMLSILSVAGCAAIEGPGASNSAAYCTPDNAFRLGTQSKAYFGGCPKESEAAFLSNLERGRALWPTPPQVWPYYAQMSQLEKQLVAAGNDADRERLRAQLRDAEWWAVQIINSPGTYSNFN
jgi:hypothetical protein